MPPNATPSTANITNVIGNTRFALKSFRASVRICPMKNTEAINVSVSPRPNRNVCQSNRPSTPPPTITSSTQTQILTPGFLRQRTASQSGIRIA